MTSTGAPAPYVVPGNPGASFLYQRVAAGSMPPPPSLSDNILGYEAGTGLTYPAPSDITILYAWILNCVTGTDGGAYASSSYGGGVAGTTCFGPCGDAGARRGGGTSDGGPSDGSPDATSAPLDGGAE
jgi:hypothetical protein